MTDQLEDQTQGGSTVDRSLPGGCMADSDLPTKGRQRGVRAVELNVAARLENLALLRTWSAPSAPSRTWISTPWPT